MTLNEKLSHSRSNHPGHCLPGVPALFMQAVPLLNRLKRNWFNSWIHCLALKQNLIHFQFFDAAICEFFCGKGNGHTF